LHRITLKTGRVDRHKTALEVVENVPKQKTTIKNKKMKGCSTKVHKEEKNFKP